jgi:hypothetical protein
MINNKYLRIKRVRTFFPAVSLPRGSLTVSGQTPPYELVCPSRWLMQVDETMLVMLRRG